MGNVGDIERITQNRVVKLFKEAKDIVVKLKRCDKVGANIGETSGTFYVQFNS